jgi:hypothetical protein
VIPRTSEVHRNKSHDNTIIVQHAAYPPKARLEERDLRKTTTIRVRKQIYDKRLKLYFTTTSQIEDKGQHIKTTESSQRPVDNIQRTSQSQQRSKTSSIALYGAHGLELYAHRNGCGNSRGCTKSQYCAKGANPQTQSQHNQSPGDQGWPMEEVSIRDEFEDKAEGQSEDMG